MITQSAGGIVMNKMKQVLIVDQNGNSWSFPKGHLEKGESALNAAKREIAEEAGITSLALIQELGTYTRFRIGRFGGEDPSEQKQITLFLFTTDEIDPKPQDPHHSRACFVHPGKALELLTHPKDKEFYQKMLPLIREVT